VAEEAAAVEEAAAAAAAAAASESAAAAAAAAAEGSSPYIMRHQTLRVFESDWGSYINLCDVRTGYL
jgi:hypothetical protein